MGAQPTKPEREEADELRKNVPQACSEAADAILDADVLLLATGAGWSAESGLAVYRDISVRSDMQSHLYQRCRPMFVYRTAMRNRHAKA